MVMKFRLMLLATDLALPLASLAAPLADPAASLAAPLAWPAASLAEPVIFPTRSYMEVHASSKSMAEMSVQSAQAILVHRLSQA